MGQREDIAGFPFREWQRAVNPCALEPGPARYLYIYINVDGRDIVRKRFQNLPVLCHDEGLTRPKSPGLCVKTEEADRISERNVVTPRNVHMGWLQLEGPILLDTHEYVSERSIQHFLKRRGDKETTVFTERRAYFPVVDHPVSLQNGSGKLDLRQPVAGFGAWSEEVPVWIGGHTAPNQVGVRTVWHHPPAN